MNFWLSVIIVILLLIIIALSIKIYHMQKSADEIMNAFSDRLKTDTNTLIDISSGDRHMRRLAKNINDELKKLRADRRKFLQGDNELKDAVTNISHDLRTPLTAICGYLDLLEKEEKSPDAQRYLKIITERTEVLKQLTQELFRYSVVISNFDKKEPEPVELNSALEESLAAHYAVITQGNIAPQLSFTENKIVCQLNKNALMRIFKILSATLLNTVTVI